MRISQIKIKNFRLLQDVELCLENSTTIIVGRNNTGKTSLTELFRRLMSESSPTFRLEDFSLGVHERFWKAFQLRHEGQDDDKIREELPIIEATLTIDYYDDKEFGPLSDFIIDLDPSCTEALVTIRYQLEAGKIEPLFEGLVFDDDKKQLFFKSFRAKQAAPGTHLVFIEEPEAHLHPQMQEVFIRKLGEIAKKFAETYSAGQPWPVQFIVTTHSSHMANEAPFDSMRYFLTTSEQQNGEPAVTKTQIKDLRKGLGGEDEEEDRKFLYRYMTLTRCDLLFADKAILIEGTTERLLLPKMIEKIEDGKQVGSRLLSQYVAVMEVGGAYAHRFYNLLDFLELRTLIITDLDTVNKNDSGKACKVSEGTGTSNGCIKNWFQNDITPTQLASKTDQDKIKGSRWLAYQVPEQTDDPCGRSFEDAFMLANPALFGIEKADDKEQAAWDLAKNVKKSDFAIKYAIEESNWVIPRYIREGLEWLADPLRPPAAAVEDEKSLGVENTPQEGKTDG